MITIDKNEILTALQIISKAVNNKSTMPILSCVLLNASGTKLKLEATNTEMAISTSITCFSEQGKICIDVKQLMEIIKKMPCGDININFDNNFKVTLSAGKKIKFNIQGQNPGNFPVIKIEKGDELVLKASDLKDAVSSVVFCASTSDSNKQMQGINIKVEDNIVKLTTLDGHRIAIRQKEVSSVVGSYDIIVPASDLNEVMKILPNSDVKVTINEKNIMLMADETIVTMRLIDGNYFKVEQMLLNDFTTSVTVAKKELYDAVDRTSLLLNEGEKRPVIMNFTDNGILLTARTGKGNAEEEIGITKKEGKDIRIGFNPKFILDMLRAIPDEEVTLDMINSRTPVVVKNSSYTYLVLPVNFADAA